RPLAAARTVVEPRPGKLDRLSRVAGESAKQSGRAWLLRIGSSATLSEALSGTDAASGNLVVVADHSGDPYRATGAAEIRLLIGPEGGFEPREIEEARAAGASIASFGPHAMRIETAAPVAAAIVLHVEGARGDGNIAPGEG